MERDHESSIDITPCATDPNSRIIKRCGQRIGHVSFPPEATLGHSDETPKVTLLAPDHYISLTQSDLEIILGIIKSEIEARKAHKQKNSFI